MLETSYSGRFTYAELLRLNDEGSPGIEPGRCFTASPLFRGGGRSRTYIFTYNHHGASPNRAPDRTRTDISACNCTGVLPILNYCDIIGATGFTSCRLWMPKTLPQLMPELLYAASRRYNYAKPRYDWRAARLKQLDYSASV